MNRVIGHVIVLIGPDPGRIEGGDLQRWLVLRVLAASDQNPLVAGKFCRGLACCGATPCCPDRCFIEQSEGRSLIGCVRRVKTGGIGTENENLAVGEKSGAGGGAIHCRLERQRIRRRIEFINGVAGVAAEEEQARVAQADRVVSRPRRRHLLSDQA